MRPRNTMQRKIVTDKPLATDVIEMLIRWARYGVRQHRGTYGFPTSSITSDRESTHDLCDRIAEDPNVDA